MVTLEPIAPVVFKTSGKLSDAPDASAVGLEQVIAPVPPTAGSMHVQPAGGTTLWNVVPGGVFSGKGGWAAGGTAPSDTNVQLAGTASEKTTESAVLAPLFVTDCV